MLGACVPLPAPGTKLGQHSDFKSWSGTDDRQLGDKSFGEPRTGTGGADEDHANLFRGAARGARRLGLELLEPRLQALDHAGEALDFVVDETHGCRAGKIGRYRREVGE